MKTSLLAFVLAANSLFATETLATPVTVEGDIWDIALLSGSYFDNYDVLSAQVWFGDQALALKFAESLGTRFSDANPYSGDPDPLYNTGPVFLYSDAYVSDYGPYNADACAYISFVDDHLCGTLFELENVVWATATPLPLSTLTAVPLPAPAFLMLGAFGGLFTASRRRSRPAQT